MDAENELWMHALKIQGRRAEGAAVRGTLFKAASPLLFAPHRISAQMCNLDATMLTLRRPWP
jgi:hypothetical protein